MTQVQPNTPFLTSDREFIPWLQQQQISLAFTTYQTSWLALIGVNPETGQFSAFQRKFDRAMGLYCTPDRLYLSSKYQLWQLDNPLTPGQLYQGYDKLYIPRIGYTTGDIDVHDVIVTDAGQPIFISTLLNCIATVSDRHSCKPLWKPPFISKIVNEDRCHLNGLAMVEGKPRYVTACSRSDVVDGWRDRRRDGGIVIDIESNEMIASGLSMPHSPRFYQGKLWVLNSGAGEFGYVDLATGKFEAIAFCPGYARGLTFWNNYAIVGLSKPRSGDGTFSGLLLDERLSEKDTDPRCGLLVIDLQTGTTLHWLRIEGTITELYDVGVLPGVQRPMALGFQTQEIEQLITLEEAIAGGAAASHTPPPLESNPSSTLEEPERPLTLAQTNVQLLEQLRRLGYSDENIEDAIRAYRFAQTLWPGRFRGSGKPFINHLVGTASILADLNAPIEAIAAALLHAAYITGDFGDGRFGISSSKRTALKQAIGETIEEYIAQYAALNWTVETLDRLWQQKERLSAVEKTIVLIRLANEIEDGLEAGYYADADRRWAMLARSSSKLCDLAQAVGFPRLGREFQKLQQQENRALPSAFKVANHCSYTVVPQTMDDRSPTVPQQKTASEPAVTIAVVPRERFSATQRSLESIYENTTLPFKLVYVDGNSPPAIQSYLQQQATLRQFHLIRTDHYLSPNQARNLALTAVATPYVVFIDNDAIVTPGWLEKLVECAEETGAGIVGPLYLIGEPKLQAIHMAGGLARIVEAGGKRFFYEEHLWAGQRLSQLPIALKREACEQLEFHCMLVRKSLFEKIGLLDEKLLSTREHIDICMLARQHGYRVIFEPAAVVSYLPPPPFEPTDIDYFLLRWSDRWNQESINHFCEKWNLEKNDPENQRHYEWLNWHRQRLSRALEKARGKNNPNSERSSKAIASETPVKVGGEPIEFPQIPPVPDNVSRPFWSVMIPTYKRVEYLQEALQSVLEQAPAPDEMQIEVVNDGADLATQERIEAIVKAVGGDRVGFYPHPHHVGHEKIFNLCLDRARGHWIHILHDDDWVKPGFYQTLRSGIETVPNIGAAFCRHTHVNAANQPHWVSWLERETPGILDDWLEKIAVMQRIQTPSIVVKREVYERLGGFCPQANPGQDWEMWKRIAARYSTWYEPQILAVYRQHPNSLSDELGFAQKIGYNLDSVEISRAYLPSNVADILYERAREYQGLVVLERVADWLEGGNYQAALSHIKLAEECSRSSSVTQNANLLRSLAEAWQDYFHPPASQKSLQEAALEKLRTLRQQVAEACMSASAEQLHHDSAGIFGKVYQLLLNSSLKYEGLIPKEQEFASRLQGELTQNSRSLQTLLALMLYRQPHELPPHWYKPIAVPAWFANTYLQWMFAPLEIFQEVGEADRYCQYMQDWVGYLHEKINANPDAASWQSTATLFTYSHNFIPLYFNDTNLKELYRMRADIIEVDLKNRGSVLDFQFPNRSGDRPKIRFGILNEHFLPQTETFTTLPCFEGLERDRFEIILYARQNQNTPLEQYCQSKADRFTLLPPETTDAVQRIRQDDLDIVLIGTNVTARANAIALMAMHRLARIQITSVSSPVTTGIRQIDCYISGKSIELEEGSQAQYQEKLTFLEGSAHCFSYNAILPPPTTGQLQRQDWGATEETVIFISGANFYKIIPELRHAWAKILAAVPNSILVLYPYSAAWNHAYPKQPFERLLRETLQEYDVPEERVVILPTLPSRTQVKECLKLADIYLDALPYSGANSTVDPLEVGLPVVVFQGNTLRSRQAAAILLELQLSELITDRPESYIKLAITLGTNPSLRQQYRQHIQEQMAHTPSFLDPHAYSTQFGAILQQLFRQWQATQSESVFRSSSTELLLNRALQFHQQQDFAAAIAFYQQVLALEPDNILALTNLGKSLQELNRHTEAISSLRRAIQLNPHAAQLHFYLSQSLKVEGDIETAASSLHEAIRLQPDFWGAYNNLATILQQQGNLEAASQYFAKALEYNPNFAHAHSNLASIWQLQGDLERAKVGFIRALELQPQYIPALLNLGYIYKQQGRLSAAIDCYQQVIALEPRAEAYYNLGEILEYQGQIERAISCYEQLQKIDGDNYGIDGYLHYARLKLCDWENYQNRTQNMLDSVHKYLTNQTAYSISPLTLSAFPVSLDLHRQMAIHQAANICQKMAASKARCAFSYPVTLTERLRIAYISPDFREHAVGKIVRDMFPYHDRTQFEVYAYSTIDYHDAITDTIRAGCDNFIDISGMSAETAARQIHGDRIHILIDLAGRTIGNAMEVLALQPAPIQAQFLGYPDTMGADFIQYAIADSWLITPEIAQSYTEEIIYLPHAFFSSPMEISTQPLTRSQFGLPENAFVFCCFNSHYKITPDLFDVWMRILQQVPDSVLWLTNGSDTVVANLRREAQQRGVAGDRLIFSDKVPLPEYLSRYQLADLFLDTFIYNAGSTAISALWAGCPILTRPGNTNASRMGASICAAAELNTLICNTTEEYEKRAVELARDGEELVKLRHHLLENRDKLPLFDLPSFVANLEAALRQLWENWETERVDF